MLKQAPPALTETRTAAFGAALIAIGPLALLLYTPALPMLETALGISQVEVQFTIVAYFLGFTVAQLVYGPLSDAFGRRIVCLFAIVLFVAASIVALVAPSADILLIARVVQGLGAAVGSVVSRAIVRDAYESPVTERILNLMALMLGIGPAIAPFIGGLIVDWVGWRHVFTFMLAYGVILLVAIYYLLPETNATRVRGRARPMAILVQYWAILREPRFLIPTTVSTLIMSNFFAVSTVLPYVLIVQVGMTPSAFGLSLLLQPLSFTIGTAVAGRLMRRIPPSRLVPPAMTILACGAIALPVLVTLCGPGVATVIGPLSVVGFSAALMIPVFWSEPLAPFGHAAGAAASLFGFFQYGLGMLGSIVATAIPDATLAAITVAPGMIIAGIVLYLVGWRWALKIRVPSTS